MIKKFVLESTAIRYFLAFFLPGIVISLFVSPDLNSDGNNFFEVILLTLIFTFFGGGYFAWIWFVGNALTPLKVSDVSERRLKLFRLLYWVSFAGAIYTLIILGSLLLSIVLPKFFLDIFAPFFLLSFGAFFCCAFSISRIMKGRLPNGNQFVYMLAIVLLPIGIFSIQSNIRMTLNSGRN